MNVKIIAVVDKDGNPVQIIAGGQSSIMVIRGTGLQGGKLNIGNNDYVKHVEPAQVDTPQRLQFLIRAELGAKKGDKFNVTVTTDDDKTGDTKTNAIEIV